VPEVIGFRMGCGFGAFELNRKRRMGKIFSSARANVEVPVVSYETAF
jgi:hypothetical protein